jgi:hypothetical protein
MGAEEIFDVFKVEQIVGPIVLNGQQSCGGYPPAYDVEGKEGRLKYALPANAFTTAVVVLSPSCAPEDRQ